MLHAPSYGAAGRRLSQAFGSVAASNQGMAVAFGLMPTLAAWATSVVKVGVQCLAVAKLRATQHSGPDTLARMHVELSQAAGVLLVCCVCANGCVGFALRAPLRCSEFRL